jgi:hypothetical protein
VGLGAASVGLGARSGLKLLQLSEGVFVGAFGGVDAPLEAFEGTLAALEAVAEGGFHDEVGGG